MSPLSVRPEEEVGLKGAAAAAERMANEGNTPDFVFAIDTFVSSDSPLESKRFADAEIGKGFVIRAVDNSNIAPREYVDRVIRLAREIIFLCSTARPAEAMTARCFNATAPWTFH